MSSGAIARSLPACLVACFWCSPGCLEYQETEDCDPARGAEQYQCPDGSLVPWCTCEDGTWECVDSPGDRCTGSEPGCGTDQDCPADEYCDSCAASSCPDCEDCVADCLPHGCETEDEPICNMLRPDCGPGQMAVVRDGCWVCVDLLTCQPARDTSCDDGTEPTCLMEPPACDPYSEILAVIQECWECVNPATCLPWGEPGCADDGWCSPGEVCDSCGTSSCPDCDDCVPACVPHGCPTEQDLMCWCARPDCGPSAVSVIYDGCWICVDRQTCQSTGFGC